MIKHDSFVLAPSKKCGESFLFEAAIIKPDKSLYPPQSSEIYKEDGARMILILTDNKADLDALEMTFIINWVPSSAAKR